MSNPAYDALADELLGLAEEMLETYGEFLPFAGRVMTNGELQVVDLGDEDHAAEHVIESLVRALQFNVRNGEIDACAICSLVTVDEENIDAIQVQFEHRSESPLTILVPLLGDDHAFGESYSIDAPSLVFGAEERR
jgi:hypothetical protein